MRLTTVILREAFSRGAYNKQRKPTRRSIPLNIMETRHALSNWKRRQAEKFNWKRYHMEPTRATT